MALRTQGFPDAMEMTVGQVLFHERVLADEVYGPATDRMVIAGSVAQATEKGRKEYWKSRKGR